MGLRDRLVNRVRKVLGKDAALPAAAPAAPPAAVAPSAAATPTPSAPPSAAAAPTPSAAIARPASPSAAARAAPPSSTPTASAASAAPEDPAEKAAKVEKARNRARKGVLLHIDKQGGSLPMSDAHDYSERRFFIAHRGFSDMMGWWLESDYIRYEEGVVHLTDSGRAFMKEAP
jgi:hypothetical protein